jgi:galactose oxidase-like protein
MILVTGGWDSNVMATPSSELYDPAGGTWTTTGSLNVARYNHTAGVATKRGAKIHWDGSRKLPSRSLNKTVPEGKNAAAAC